MKLFTYILTILAVVLIAFNITKVDLENPFIGDSIIALMIIVAGLCAIVLLAILRISKRIEINYKQSKHK